MTGWCGVGKVMRRNKARDRVQILQLHGYKRDAFLRDDGHPELARRTSAGTASAVTNRAITSSAGPSTV